VIRYAAKNSARCGGLSKKKEVWLNTSDDPGTGDCRAIPAIYLCYWRVQEGKQPGFGKMLGYAYSLHDNTFETNWELLN
jgi:hypothetical protein